MSKREEGFSDTRRDASGRPSTRTLTSDEQIVRLQHQVKYLKQENEFLKKNKFSKSTGTMEAQAKPEEKFKIIYQLTQRDNNLLNISWLCECAGVSRSGYYNWIASEETRRKKDEQDKKDFEIILENIHRYV